MSIDLSGVPDVEAVFTLMQQLLDDIVYHFAENDVDLPGRQYVTVGQTAHDCEQLTVGFIQMYLGTPGDRIEVPQNCQAPRSIVLTVQLVRKVALPQGRTTPPDPEEITELTKQKTGDAWLLMDAVQKNACDTFGVIADVSVTNPQGEYQAVQLNVSVGVP